VTFLILAGAVLLAQPPQGSAVAAAQEPDERIMTAIGYYAGSEEGDDGTRLKLDDAPLRFRLPRLSDAELQRWVGLVSTASQRGFALRVRFDGTAGRLDAQSATVTYPMCSLSVGDVRPLGNEAANCPAVAASSRPSSSSSLARGIAVGRAHPEVAISLLGEALADRGVAPSLQAIGLRARAEAREALSLDQEWGGETFDRLMVASLADHRARLAINPNDAEAHYAVGKALAELGAYDDALAIYANIARRWPDEAFRVATRTGAIYRQQGEYRRALAQLDDFAARNGRPDGMRFSYHRAWTLVKLGRFQDAIVEIDIGLQTQPDYSSAWILRSCAKAQIGAIDDARRDQERGLELLESLARNGEPGLDADIARSRRLVAALGETRSAVSAGTLDDVCRAPWRNYERTRPRSQLLGASPG